MSGDGPCTCWTSPRCPEHDGHCCFGPTAPEDCHDEAGRAALNRAYHFSTDPVF
jgi:hypothetical protein